MEGRKRGEGFTLIELLIVVAIIAILAAIAVPNFLEAQTRSKVARVQTDMRSLATAMEAYRVDWNSVPIWFSADGAVGGAAGRRQMSPGYFWWALSTPEAYLTAAIPDAFVAIGHHSQASHIGDDDLLDAFIQVSPGFLGRYQPGEDGTHPKTPRDLWCAASYGPDSADDTTSFHAYPYTRYALPYDPTNGTVSWGDIYRFGGRVPSNFVVGNWQGGGHGSNASSQGNADPFAWTH